MATTDRLRTYLTSRKNIAGMAGAVVGAGLHLGGLVGDLWPVAAVALYGVAALATPSEKQDESFTSATRDALEEFAERVPRRLPVEIGDVVRRMLDALRLVLERLDELVVSDDHAQRASAPDRLVAVAQVVNTDLPTVVDRYLQRPQAVSEQQARDALLQQLQVIAHGVDRIVGDTPDVHLQRLAELTEDLRRRYGG